MNDHVEADPVAGVPDSGVGHAIGKVAARTTILLSFLGAGWTKEISGSGMTVQAN
jgi:hypothetical protein